jgi:hypothetical protein
MMSDIDDIYPPLQNIFDEEVVLTLLIGEVQTEREMANVVEFAKGMLKLCNLWDEGLMRGKYDPSTGKFRIYRKFRIIDRYFLTLN